MADNVYKEGKITIIEAPQRKGKTLTMSILALDEYIARRTPIITTIAYENPETHKIKIPYEPLNFFQLTMAHIDGFLNRCITVDELNFYLDSRGSMTKVNRRFCQWLLQSKKMGINTYGTTHGVDYLDLRFRENFDYLIQPNVHYETINEGTKQEMQIPRYLVMKWMNGPNQARLNKTITLDFHKKPQLLGMYNTRNVFNPFQEMEEHMQQEKEQQKEKQKRVRHRPYVPQVNPVLQEAMKRPIPRI